MVNIALSLFSLLPFPLILLSPFLSPPHPPLPSSSCLLHLLRPSLPSIHLPSLPFPSPLFPSPLPPFLAQFNVAEWMTRHSPDDFTCQELLKTIIKGLSICGIHPTDEAMLFEVRLWLP